MRRYVVFAVVSLALFLSSVGATTVSVALPVIISDFNASLVLAGWVLSVYQLVAVCAMPLTARMSEVLGPKFTFMLSIVLFTAGSILCAIAPNLGWLIAFRAIQGMGGGAFMPSAAGIVSDEFPEMRQRALGFVTSVFPIGAVVGPNIGGWMVSSFGWKSIFWFNVPLGIFIFFAVRRLLRSKSNKKAGAIDLAGAGWLIGLLASFLLTLTFLGNAGSGVSWNRVALLLVLSAVFLWAFVHRERKVQEPVINLALLMQRPFLAANIFNLIYGACAMGIFSLMPLYAVKIYDLSILQSGLILTPRSAAMMTASAITSFYLLKWGYRRPILIGTLIVITGLFLLAAELRGVSLNGFELSASAWLVLIMAFTGIGVGFSAPAANNACIELMPDRVATITGVRGMFRQLGGAMGITVATLILENVSDIHRAFLVIFVSFGLVTIFSIPAIFIIPSRPSVGPFHTGAD